MNAEKFYTQEINIINRVLRDFGVDAGTLPSLIGGSAYSHVYYEIKRGRGVSQQAVEKVFPEISEAIKQYRVNTSVYKKLQENNKQQFLSVRLNSDNAIEVYPMNKRVMCLGVTQLRPGYFMAGKSFTSSGERLELIDYTKLPHVLVAGTTGSGKSVMLYNLLSSVVANHTPVDSQLIVIDLKNQDLAQLRDLRLTHMFAGTEEEALHVILYLWQVMLERRKSDSVTPNKIFVVIDEIAQLSSIKVSSDPFKTSDSLALPKHIDLAFILGKLCSIVRSLNMHIIIATQQPTKEGGLSGMIKANCPVRLVGAIASKEQAFQATQINMSGAELLPGQGSFLRIENGRSWRVQSFNMEQSDLLNMEHKPVDQVVDVPSTGLVSSTKPVDVGPQPVDVVPKPVDQPVDDGLEEHNFGSTSGRNGGGGVLSFPIGKLRKLTVQECVHVIKLSWRNEYNYGGKVSLRRLAIHVFGSADTARIEEIRQALQVTTPVANNLYYIGNEVVDPPKVLAPTLLAKATEMHANGYSVTAICNELFGIVTLEEAALVKSYLYGI